VKKAPSELVAAAEKLRDELARLARRRGAGPARTVLLPLEYAWENHKAYLERHARRGVEAVLVGMNPGPWGMGQTGVPFGDPGLVRDFLGIAGAVERPRGEHARCPILGLESPRGEVSGQRLWGAARACFGTPDDFFARFFVANYCPLLFLGASGANVTPDKVPARWMAPVLAACDEHLREVVRVLRPARVVGIGAWATRRAREALGDERVRGTLLHPSPASPAANRGWLKAARKQLEELGCPWPAPR
jgi:single-strand selective monofunctional uracil DNA glycosylase